MERTPHLNHSSPIVQRVLRVRERLPLSDIAADPAQSRTRYQWQMWQKSDFSAYAGDRSEHRCKNTPSPSGQEAHESELQRIPVLPQRLSTGDPMD
jgi:hypothetical protein